MRHTLVIVALFAVHAPVSVWGQDVVPVGKGSYASSPPASAGDGAKEMLKSTFSLLGTAKPPIPTNKLWTWLLKGEPSGSLWMYPWRVDPKETGLELFLPVAWNPNGTDPVCEAPLRIEGLDFKTKKLSMKHWGDWTLSFRLGSDDKKYLDVTTGEGMPLVWVEPHGLDLSLRASPEARALDDGGKPLTFPFSGKQFLISAPSRSYGVYLPPGAKVTRQADLLRIAFADRRCVAFGAVVKQDDFKACAQAAYAVPRDSTMEWSFDPQQGKVVTRWIVKTEPVTPGQADVVLQGWLAHHWRGAEHQLALTGPEYLTSRGKMKTSLGNRFELTYDFKGILPSLPAPQKVSGDNAYQAERLEQLLVRRASEPKYGDDSYWGAKDLLQFAQYLHFAKAIGSPTSGKLQTLARGSLADWLTYTPGEAAHYFARYENWRALIGFKDSYDSARFNDQHFHYGYFTLSAALLEMEDPEFLKDYGEMLRLVAKQYANWDRQDTRFPFLRTFDIWAGHSWAGGMGSPGGNNQESTSEAMQSWIGLFLLGTLLDDPDMTATGAMGYCLESRATMEYWFNVRGDNFPKEYQHPIVGVLWSGGNVFGTYFSGDPAWVYAIQCLPQSPGLDYLAEGLESSRKLFRQILQLRKVKEGSDDLAVMGDLGNCMLSQASLIEPEWAARELDRLWDANNDIAAKSLDAARTYYHAHSYRHLGPRNWDARLSLPTGSVYTNPKTGTTTYVAYNPKEYPQVVEATQSGKSLGRFLVSPRQMTSVTKLETAPATGLAGTIPKSGDTAVDRRIETLYAVFHQPMDEKTLSTIRLEGPRAAELSCSMIDGGRVVVCRIKQPLKPGERYRFVLPSSIRQQDGKSPFSQDQSIAFTIEPQPPLGLESASPAAGQDRVAIQTELILTFNAPISADSAARVKLEGPKAPTLTPASIGSGARWKFQLNGELQPDSNYTLLIPAGIKSIFDDSLKQEIRQTFVTVPGPCPPQVYGESFAGHGHWKSEVDVDFGNLESPHTGQRAIKLQTKAKDGGIAFFAGTQSQGAGRTPLDLSKYQAIEFWMKGTCDKVWVKIGHPVFDKNAFTQVHQEGIGREYRRFTLKLPEPKNEINTVLEFGLPANSTLFVDDIRFVTRDAADRKSSK